MKNESNNIEEKQYKELKEINFWFIINTIFTIITGVATLVLAILQYIKR